MAHQVLGTNKVAGGYGLHRWTGNNWQALSGGAVRIAVDPNGNPWVINNQNKIFRYSNGWIQLPDKVNNQAVNGQAIGVGANGAAWVATTDQKVYVWNNNSWEDKSGQPLTEIAVGPDGRPYGVYQSAILYMK